MLRCAPPWAARSGTTFAEEFTPLTEDSLLFDGPRPTYGRVRVLHQIGAGSMGPVFRGEDPATAGPVVVKVLRVGLSPERVAIVTTALAAMRERLAPHPALCPILETGVHEAEPFVVSAFVDGDSLDVALREYGPANISDALPRLRALADALDSAAAAGIVHGSLHLRDIMVSVERTVLTGIGVVSALERVGVRAPVRRPYCAPEIAQGLGVSPAGDQFALAAIAHEWLSGRRIAGPGGEGFHLPAASAAGTEAVAAVFCRALDELPDERYPTASAFVDGLEEVADALAPRVKAARRRRAATDAPRLAFDPHEDPSANRQAPVVAAPVLGSRDDRAWASTTDDDAGSTDEARLSMGRVDEGDDDPMATVSLLRDDPEAGDAADDAVAALEFAPLAIDEGPPPADAIGFDRAVATPDIEPLPGPAARASAPAPAAVAAVPAPPVEPEPAPVVAPVVAAEERPVRPRLMDRPAEPPRRSFMIEEPALGDDPEGNDVEEDDRPSGGTGWAAMIVLVIALAVGGGYALVQWGTPSRPDTQATATPPVTPAAPPAAGSGGTPAPSPQPAPSGPSAAPPPAASAPPAPPTAPAKASPVEAAAPPQKEATAPAKTAVAKTPAAATGARKDAAVPGRLQVRSRPSGAEVFVNGDRRGVTPLTLRELPSGAYALRIARAGYNSSEQRITLDARRPSRVVDVTLTRAASSAAAPPPTGGTTPGSLLVETRPPGARVVVDGREVGSTPLTLPALAAGDHAVRIELAGYQPIATTTRVEPGARARLAVSLTIERQQ